ncbi:MAG: AsmA-like C-terminal region-containing protein [Pseudomonadota bacterium]
MRHSSPRRLIVRILFVCVVILAIPLAALLLISAGPFEDVRRKAAEHFLSTAIDVPVEIKGPVEIGFSLEPTVSVQDIVAVESRLPSDMKDLSIKDISVEIPLLPILTGHVDLEGLDIDGLKVVIDIPPGRETEYEGVEAIGEFVSNVVHSAVSSNFELHDTTFDLVDQESGFTLRYGFDAVVSKAKDDGSIRVDAKGHLNDEPWKLAGDVKPRADDNTRTFDFSIDHAGIAARFAGDYNFGSVGDVVDLKVTAKSPSLENILKIYEIKGELDGTGDLTARISGPMEALKLSDLMLKLAFESGDVYTVSGGIDDLSAMTGLQLSLDGTLKPHDNPDGQVWPFLRIGITGFSGKLRGSHDGVLVRDFTIDTTALDTTLSTLGPITAERLFKDKDGRLGLYDLVILAGDANKPGVRITGDVKDVIDFEGVDLKGVVDIPTTEFLDLTVKKEVAGLGRFAGDFAVSDADGSLGLEKLSAKVTGSKLLALALDLSYDDVKAGDDFKLATKLDIPSFEALATALGTKVGDVGQIKFDGDISGGKDRLDLSGTALAGQTTIKGVLSGAVANGKPALTGSLSSPLLHLSDMKKVHAVGTTYLANVNEKDLDVVNYGDMWKDLPVDLKVDVAKIAGGGTDASHIKGRITYLAGLVGLDPLSLTYLGGRATASGKIDTRKKPTSFALKGRVDRLRMGAILKEMEESLPVRGTLTVDYDLSGAGDSLAAIPRTLSGSVNSSLRDGWIGTDLINLTGMSLPAWLLSRRQGGAELVCMVAPFGFREGRGTTHGLVFETREVQIAGVGYVNLRRDTIDMRFKPQPLRQELIKVTQPFAIQGNLYRPKLHLEGAPVLNALAGSLAFPFNALDHIIQPKLGEVRHRPCHVIHTTTREQRRLQEREAQRERGTRGPLGLGIFGGEQKRERERERARERRR